MVFFQDVAVTAIGFFLAIAGAAVFFNLLGRCHARGGAWEAFQDLAAAISRRFSGRRKGEHR